MLPPPKSDPYVQTLVMLAIFVALAVRLIRNAIEARQCDSCYERATVVLNSDRGNSTERVGKFCRPCGRWAALLASVGLDPLEPNHWPAPD